MNDIEIAKKQKKEIKQKVKRVKKEKPIKPIDPNKILPIPEFKNCFMIIKLDTTGLIGTYDHCTSVPKYDKLEYYENARLISVKIGIYKKNPPIYDLVEENNIIIKSDLNIFDEVSQINKISTDMLKKDDSIKIETALKIIAERFLSVDNIFVQNARFDMNILKSEFFRAEKKKWIKYLKPKKIQCLKTKTKVLFPNPNYVEELYSYYPGCNYVPKYLAKPFDEIYELFLKKKELRENRVQNMKELIAKLIELNHISI